MKKLFGVMLDVSRNGVMKIDKIKEFIDYISLMGYNALELYSEDIYEIKEIPELGYMRGKYSVSDLKELDKYAANKGVELIPCIQTLAHFTNFKKTIASEKYIDIDDILLVDDENTYFLIECLFKTCAEAFTSRNINIGMDEAHNLGLGKYLKLHGYENRTDILLKHLKKVSKIAEKYGFTCHMWSDMFIRLVNGGEYYVKEGQKISIDEKVKKEIPANIKLAYWDYYSNDIKHYDRQFEIHKLMSDDFYFAGGIHSWNGFAPGNAFSINSMKAAMESCNKNNVKNIIMTMWGDNGKECSFFNLLPSLFAISEFYKQNFDLELIKSKFNSLFNLNFDDFMLLDSASYPADATYKLFSEHLNRGPVYCDPFVNTIEVALSKVRHIDYLERYKMLIEAGKRNKKFEYLFKTQAYLCKFLHYKFDLSMELRKAYQENNKVELRRLTKIIATSIKVLDEFKDAFYTCYLKDNKSYGIEIHNIRFGGLKERLLFCKKTIESYLCGKIDSIQELNEKLIETENHLHVVYQLVISPSDITHG